MKKTLLLASLPITLTLFSGCTAVTGHSKSVESIDNQLLSGNCDLTELDKKVKDKEDIVFNGVQAASIARSCEDYKKSNKYFDEVENVYKEDVDKDNAINNTFESLKSVVVNNNTNDYEGNTYEKIMINTPLCQDSCRLVF